MTIPTGRAEELRRRLMSKWLNNRTLRDIAHDAVRYVIELEAERRAVVDAGGAAGQESGPMDYAINIVESGSEEPVYEYKGPVPREGEVIEDDTTGQPTRSWRVTGVTYSAGGRKLRSVFVTATRIE